VAPFFRVPGLAHSDVIEDELAARHLVWFSPDTDANDWYRGISSKKIISLAMSRSKLAAKESVASRYPPCNGRRIPRSAERTKAEGLSRRARRTTSVGQF